MVYLFVMSTLISNKKTRFNYQIEKTYVAGLELFGFEVKSLRESRGSLDGSYIIIRGGEAYLIETYIPPYQPANTRKDYNERRPRKLLLKKIEIKEIADEEVKKGKTIVPISIFTSGKKIKIEIAIVSGKKQHDKRETAKKREVERELKREKSIRNK